MGEMLFDFVLIGVQGVRLGLGSSLTTPVRKAVPRVIDAVLKRTPEVERLVLPRPSRQGTNYLVGSKF